MIAPQIIDEMRRRLTLAEAEHRVKVLLAVESGSRAWGFASSNSDYDGRFIYINQPDWYMSVSLEEQRDVIEYPIVDEMDINGWDFTGDSMRLANVWFDVSASPDSLYHLTVRRVANGRTDEEAKIRAAEFTYTTLLQDSLLDLASSYSIGKNSKYRIQQVGILIQVPKGKKIRFDASVTDKLNIGRVTVNRRNRRNMGISIENDYDFSFMTGVDYNMGIDGKLQQDGLKQSDVTPRRSNTGNYRYNSADTVAPAATPEEEAQKQLEEEKRKIREESERRIKELEDKAKAAKPVSLLKKKKDARIEGDIVGIPSPVSSLVL